MRPCSVPWRRLSIYNGTFFLTGDEATLHPMILKDVVERAGYDISTISRVSNSKYVQTNFGIYPLKYFFLRVYADRYR